MRILLINNLFQPEPNHLKGLAFAQELRNRGHKIHVLTGFPNYPGGKLYPGYRMRWAMQESFDDIPVTRVAMYPSHDGSASKRMLTYISTGMSQALYALLAKNRFDLCHVYMGPITLMWPACILKRMQGTKVVADVQDIWPESVLDSGMLSSAVASRLLQGMSRNAYRRADGLIVLSPGVKELLATRGIDPARVEVVYNWCDECPGRSSQLHGIPPGILGDRTFNVVYAGNLGKLQGLDTVLDAAKLLGARNARVRFLLIGNGVESDRVRARIKDEHILNMCLFPRMPSDEVNAILAQADLLLIHLVRSKLSSIAVPQKVQAYLAAGRPILAAVEGEALNLFKQSGGGVSCEPENAQALAETVSRVMALSATEREHMGQNGQRFYRENLRFEKGIDQIERFFLSLLDDHHMSAN